MEIAIFLVILLFVIVSGLSKIFSTEKTTISEEPKASQAKEDPSEEKEIVSLNNEIPTLENIDTDFEKIAIEEIKEKQQSAVILEEPKASQAKEDPAEEKETVSLNNEIPTLENIDTNFEKIAIEEIKEKQQSAVISEEPKASQAKEDPAEEKETVSLNNEIPTLENIDTDFESIAIEEIKEEQQSTFDIENEKTNFIQARVEKLPGMVAVEKNSFQMGDTLGDGRDNEKPSHTVTITYDYYIASYEVSFEEYGRYAEDVLKTKHKVFRENSVVNVSWYEAIDYCNWLSKREGLSKAYSASGNFLDKNGRKTTDPSEVEGYRLPTEAEWESARSIISKNNDIWEWCSDWYSESYYEKSPQINPYNSSQEAFRVKRGGSLANNTNIRVSCRSYDYPKHRREDVGFRIARTKT